MLAPENTALVLLAAGRSVRFGPSDKLAEQVLDQALGLHVVTALAATPFARRIAVTGGTRLDYAARGYQVVRNGRPERGLSQSVRLGVAAARGDGVAAVLIALADMPRITAAHVRRLFEAQYGPDTMVASSDGAHARPPALFGSSRFDALAAMRGDAGARDLLLAGRHVVTHPDELIDVDTAQDLADLRTKSG